MQPVKSDDYRNLLIKDVPLMDMRAPVEFAQGAFPNSTSLPLMSDDERAAVGTCYKEKGQDAAIKLGHSLVYGAVKAERIAQWKAFAEANPNGYLYCFRGGLRSQISQQWLKEAGIDYPYVTGGYKAIRRYCLDAIERLSESPRIVLAGRTGSGKTWMIEELDNGIDLEGAAHHRGSSFGQRALAPSSQIDFENTLAADLLKAEARGHKQFVFEDEGRVIGPVNLPIPMYNALQDADIVQIDDPQSVRLERLLKDYVITLLPEFQQHYGEDDGWCRFESHLQLGLDRIQRRLGGERYVEACKLLSFALAQHKATGSVAEHEAWLVYLLDTYYDPMYDYQLSKKSERIVFRGAYDEVQAWLQK
jgi:tRNA 2-selenouridine synthase